MKTSPFVILPSSFSILPLSSRRAVKEAPAYFPQKKTKSSYLGHQVLSIVRSKVVLFMFRNRFLDIFFLQVPFFLVLTFITCFGFTNFQKFHKTQENKDNLSSNSCLLRLYTYQQCEPKPNKAKPCDEPMTGHPMLLNKAAFVCLALSTKHP